MLKRLIVGSRQRINDSNISTEQAAESLIPYIEAGIIHFDTADHYADGEDLLGILKKQYGDTITISTKRCPDPGPIQSGETRKAIETSLQRLQSEQIDLLQFHDRDPSNHYGFERLAELVELQQKGFIKNLGMTNASVEYLEKCLVYGIPISSNQICNSFFAQRKESDMQDFCKTNDIEILAFGTVAGGFFSEKRLGVPEPNIHDLSNASLKKYKRFMDVVTMRDNFQELLKLLAIIAKNHNVSIATIASRYILQQDATTAVIVGARLGQSEHLQENLKILTLQLSIEENIAIKEVCANFKQLPGDFGDEYRLDHSDLSGGHEFLTSTGSGGYKGHQNNFIK